MNRLNAFFFRFRDDDLNVLTVRLAGDGLDRLSIERDMGGRSIQGQGLFLASIEQIRRKDPVQFRFCARFHVDGHGFAAFHHGKPALLGIGIVPDGILVSFADLNLCLIRQRASILDRDIRPIKIPTANVFDRLRDVDLHRSIAKSKDPIIEPREPLLKRHRFKACIGERALPDGHDACRDRDAFQSGAVIESALTDMGQAFRQNDGLDLATQRFPGLISIIHVVIHGSAAGDGQGAGELIEGPIEGFTAGAVGHVDFKGCGEIPISHRQGLCSDGRGIEPSDEQVLCCKSDFLYGAIAKLKRYGPSGQIQFVSQNVLGLVRQLVHGDFRDRRTIVMRAQ